MKATPPVIKAADPIPAMNLKTNNVGKLDANPDNPLPIAPIMGPPTSTAFRPFESEIKAAGIFVINLASPKALTANPIWPAEIPKESANNGTMGTATPWPVVINAVEIQRKIIAWFENKIFSNLAIFIK